MSKFKLKAPYGIDPVARYEVPFTPDNVGDDNGLDGAICNITYYKHSLSADQIALSYNTMITSNLPIPRKKDNKSD